MRWLLSCIGFALLVSPAFAQAEVAKAKATAQLLLAQQDRTKKTTATTGSCGCVNGKCDCCDVCHCSTTELFKTALKETEKSREDSDEYRKAWELHMKTGKPLVLFIGIPARPVEGAISVRVKENAGNTTPRIVVVPGPEKLGYGVPVSATDVDIRNEIRMRNYPQSSPLQFLPEQISANQGYGGFAGMPFGGMPSFGGGGGGGGRACSS